MKINLLKEGFFKNPEQARAARAAQTSKSSAERLAATAAEIQNNNIIKIVNDVIDRHNIPLFPRYFLVKMQYYSLNKAVEERKYFSSADVVTKYEKDDLRLLRVKFDDDKFIFTMNTAFPATWNKYTGKYDAIPISMAYIDNHITFTDEKIELHMKYFLLALKYWLEEDYANDKVDDSALKIIEYLDKDKVEFDKIHLFTGYDNVYFTPDDKVNYNQYEANNGKYITTDAINYGSWNGAISVMRLGKTLGKYFVFGNSGKLGFIYTHDQQGPVDMSVLKSPSLKSYTDDFISSLLTTSNENFMEFVEKLMKDGDYKGKQYRDGEFVLPKREETQIKKWLNIRKAAIDSNLIKIEKIDREIITYGAVIDINKETCEMNIGKDFLSNDDVIRVNAVIHIKLAGVPEEIAITQILNCKAINGKEISQYIYCTDMGTNSLKRGLQTIDGYTREIFEFPDHNFPILYANSQFNTYLIEQLQQRIYEVDKGEKHLLEKVGKDFIDVLYLEATGDLDTK